jgi:hypothetical protein
MSVKGIAIFVRTFTLPNKRRRFRGLRESQTYPAIYNFDHYRDYFKNNDTFVYIITEKRSLVYIQGAAS